jgi:hypothetical protein
MPAEADAQRELWQHHYDRFGVSVPGKPRRLLALDGGGIRGILTLEILAEIERQLAEITKKGAAFRLCDYFDYVGGTSTGAIIAAGLACGMSTKELIDFYISIGPQMFERAKLLERLKHMYTADPLGVQLQKTFGADTTLGSAKLRCLLLAVTRNVSTDSAWPVSNAPPAKYNARDRSDSNLQIPLWQLVRASTAAPIYFPPEILAWEKGNPDKSFVFVDGGMTPYNNPSFLLFRMATSPAFRLGWDTGEDRMMLVSVGTGAAADLGADVESPQSNIAATLTALPGALMGGSSVDQDINCRVMGRCVHGAPIDGELHDLIPRGADGRSWDEKVATTPLEVPLGRQFLYARYNADLSDDGLKALGLTGVDSRAVRKLDAIGNIDNLRKIGQLTGKRDVRLREQFGTLATSVV